MRYFDNTQYYSIESDLFSKCKLISLPSLPLSFFPNSSLSFTYFLLPLCLNKDIDVLIIIDWLLLCAIKSVSTLINHIVIFLQEKYSITLS